MKAENKILLPVVIILLLMIGVCLTQTDKEDRQTKEIESCEEHLDSIASHCSFMDTIGETDEYFFLCEAHKKFINAQNDEEKNQAYKEYMYWYNRCVDMHIDLTLTEMKDSL